MKLRVVDDEARDLGLADEWRRAVEALEGLYLFLPSRAAKEVAVDGLRRFVRGLAGVGGIGDGS